MTTISRQTASSSRPIAPALPYSRRRSSGGRASLVAGAGVPELVGVGPPGTEPLGPVVVRDNIIMGLRVRVTEYKSPGVFVGGTVEIFCDAAVSLRSEVRPPVALVAVVVDSADPVGCISSMS